MLATDSLSDYLWKSSFYSHSWRVFPPDKEFWVGCFSFCPMLITLLYLLLACWSRMKSPRSFKEYPSVSSEIYILVLLSLFFSFAFSSLTMVGLDTDFTGLTFFELHWTFESTGLCLPQKWRVFSLYFFTYSFCITFSPAARLPSSYHTTAPKTLFTFSHLFSLCSIWKYLYCSIFIDGFSFPFSYCVCPGKFVTDLFGFKFFIQFFFYFFSKTL